ncbi:N-acetyl-1-D-myo-inositol-2-amino-2-deoxy-alpha-D-glucopyranoside deacetylase [Streptomyces neyagawaensis]|uniref:N-acetyl-1-D-myo-inositol-2-amino-2-deoxy-alpha- D-glucopyranoside deacetylase n=1 Tax=Streptomyces neyagawaensis TaxID=42238 RepID=UPI00099F192C|nr:N-acetyl-1-D-myo-inositol-2-amino-2-deoxy-alpha-D-glucopyranoside deacetylase [Streptomyces neyagawaensis]MCL6739234.1 N-acetyl-1-D-myo-inositol-2-amino-2-deoxy-alpha-D-glucopyranoside deacetylase [Streptomyces neyagawaensis]MDE1688830.1 N-acetyl-1-D-myo-inositol-2-amino-2-deoxy-alpha-D-glucopyranoside deacetylase [Streptomyces neyagawaensis]
MSPSRTHCADRDFTVPRLLLVHAHPDDETICTGATMARYAAEGVAVTLVTCTLGEEGEVIPLHLASLVSGRKDRLGQRREGELRSALAQLGVYDHRILGAPGRYRDSGMADSAGNDRSDCFWRADVGRAAAELAEVIREVRPQVVVTYGPDGSYGHPDHIQAHRVTMRAVDLAAAPGPRSTPDEPHAVHKVYWCCGPRSVVQDAFAELRHHPDAGHFDGFASPEDFPGLVDDTLVTTAVDGGAYKERKKAAMRAHVSQRSFSFRTSCAVSAGQASHGGWRGSLGPLLIETS